MITNKILTSTTAYSATARLHEYTFDNDPGAGVVFAGSWKHPMRSTNVADYCNGVASRTSVYIGTNEKVSETGRIMYKFSHDDGVHESVDDGHAKTYHVKAIGACVLHDECESGSCKGGFCCRNSTYGCSGCLENGECNGICRPFYYSKHILGIPSPTAISNLDIGDGDEICDKATGYCLYRDQQCGVTDTAMIIFISWWVIVVGGFICYMVMELCFEKNIQERFDENEPSLLILLGLFCCSLMVCLLMFLSRAGISTDCALHADSLCEAPGFFPPSQYSPLTATKLKIECNNLAFNDEDLKAFRKAYVSNSALVSTGNMTEVVFTQLMHHKADCMIQGVF